METKDELDLTHADDCPGCKLEFKAAGGCDDKQKNGLLMTFK